MIWPYEWDESDRTPDSVLALADVLLDRSAAELQFTLDDTSDMDAKALHLTVGAIAVFAILVGFKQDWVWAIPEALLGAAVACFFYVYKPRDWEVGPDLVKFRPPDRVDGPADAPAIKRAMADQLLYCAVENTKVLERKSRVLIWGYGLLAIGLFLALGLAVFGPR
jgi:hypothetical protein